MELGTQDVSVALGDFVASELHQPVTISLVVCEHCISVQTAIHILGHEQLRRLSLSTRCTAHCRTEFIRVFEKIVGSLYDVLPSKGYVSGRVDQFGRLFDP
ncbi:hypothetical protein D3C77_572980 [compost metagenome]